MKTKSLFSFFTALLLVAMSAVPAMPRSAAAQQTWDMPMAYSATNYHSEIGAEFAAEVSEKSGGALIIKTHPGGSLFGGGEIYGAVRRGIAPIGERFIGALSNQDAFFGLDNLPFLATTFDEARVLYEVSKDTLIAKLAADGLVFLYSAPWPPQGLYSVREVNSKADLKGLKFRAYNPLTSRLAELLEMAPTTIETAELQQAFATGLAQAMITSGATGYDRKMWEHVPYYYDVRAWVPRNMVFVNKEAWDSLDAKTQQVVRTAAANAERKGWEKAENLADWYVAQFVKNGMTVDEASAQLRADFVAAGEVLKKEWSEQAGSEGAAVLKQYADKR